MQRVLVIALGLFVALSRIASADRETDDDLLFHCKPAKPDAKLSVVFKADTPMRDIVTWFTGFSCKNVVISTDAVAYASTVTLVAPNKVSPKQATQLFVDAVEATGLVVVQKPDTMIIKLGPNTPKPCASVASTPPVAPTEAELGAGIRVVDDTHRTITQALAERIVAGGARGETRIAPSVHDGKPNGFKLYAIRPGSILDRFGLTNGDTLVSCNGNAFTSDFDMAWPHLVFDAALKAGFNGGSLTLQLERRGKPLSLVVAIH